MGFHMDTLKKMHYSLNEIFVEEKLKKESIPVKIAAAVATTVRMILAVATLPLVIVANIFAAIALGISKITGPREGFRHLAKLMWPTFFLLGWDDDDQLTGIVYWSVVKLLDAANPKRQYLSSDELDFELRENEALDDDFSQDSD